MTNNMKPASEAEVVERQVLLAGQMLNARQKTNSAWLWFDDDPRLISFGRWQRVPEQAPYVRADLILTAARALGCLSPEEAAALRDECNAKGAARNAYQAHFMKAVEALTKMQSERDALAARGRMLEEELAWYGEQARMARLIHSGGDPGRHALANDGGNRAHAALSTEARPDAVL